MASVLLPLWGFEADAVPHGKGGEGSALHGCYSPVGQ